MPDKRMTGELNELAVLRALHRFGWLTTRMTAYAVWPASSQAQAMARRTLARLRKAAEVIERELPDSGGSCHVLTPAGARRLRRASGELAESGVALRLGNPVHRACSNWFLLRKQIEGFGIWTEHEIQTGRAGHYAYEGKVADGYYFADGCLVWVEVENTWKNREERARIVRLVEDNLDPPDGADAAADSVSLGRVAIVSTNTDALRHIVGSFAEAFRHGTVREAQLFYVEVSLLPILRNLASGPFIEAELWHGVLEPRLRADPALER